MPCCKDLACIYSRSLHSSPVGSHLHFTDEETEALETHIYPKDLLHRLRTPQTYSWAQRLHLSEYTAGGMENTLESESIHGHIQIKEAHSPLLDTQLHGGHIQHTP